MNRYAVELSVRYGGQSEGEHARIGEHAYLILWQTDPVCVLNTGFAPVVRLNDKLSHSFLFGNAAG